MSFTPVRFLTGVLFLGGNMKKEEFRKELFDLKLRQYLYAVEHKKLSSTLKDEEKILRKTYIRSLINKK